MKFILKDGTEFEVRSIAYNFNVKNTSDEVNCYSISMAVGNKPTELVSRVTSSFTEENISSATTIELMDGEEVVSEYSFKEVVRISFSINDSGKSLLVSLK